MSSYSGNLRQYAEQSRRAAAVMNDFNAYARSIGCDVMGDAVIVHSIEQQSLLNDWWSERTECDRLTVLLSR